MSIDPTRADIHALSGAYAVDALDDIERAEFERHLTGCPTCRDEVDDLRETAAALAEATSVEPPAALRERLLAEIRTVRPLPPVVEPAAHPIRARRRWIALVAAAAVIALGAVAWHPWTSPSPTQLTAVAQVQQAPDAQRFTTHLDGGTVTVYRSVSLDRAALVSRDVGAAPDGKVYQVWLQNPAGAMVPAGFLQPGSSASVALSGEAASATAAGITVEPAGGSPRPTSDPVALVAFAS
ncbi:MAG: anti-sigma factor [Nocardioides sp.]